MKSRLIILFLLISFPVWAGWVEEEARINYLLTEISRVDGVFIRNGTEHSPGEAVKHLGMKLERAMSSWFAPDKSEWTAELFIEKLASKSSLSGKPYQIKFKGGRIVNSGPWLLERLKSFPHNP